MNICVEYSQEACKKRKRKETQGQSEVCEREKGSSDVCLCVPVCVCVCLFWCESVKILIGRCLFEFEFE